MVSDEEKSMSLILDGESHMTTSIMRFINNRLSHTIISNWFNGVEIKFNQNGVATIFFPSNFARDWVLSHYRDVLEDAFWTISKTKVFHSAISKEGAKAQGKISENSLQLDNAMRFSTFVVGKSNEMAFHAANRVSTSKNTFNPLFIYGQPGVGKTHLMQAIAWQLKDSGKRVCYTTAEHYMLSFLKAIKTRNMLEFKDSFRSVDALLLEDFQFMDSKEATQEEIFHTFVRLINAKVLIVVSADKKPSELSGIDKRLKSRLGGGLTVYIHTPSFELRLAILEQKAKMHNKDINPLILEMLARRVQTNVRELEGALTRICAQIDFFGKEITLETASAALDEMLNSTTKAITADMIIDTICDFYKISKEVLLSNTRLKAVVRARQLAILLCREAVKKSLPEIGKIFGGKDHTTALYAIKTMKQKMQKDITIKDDIEKLKKILYAN